MGVARTPVPEMDLTVCLADGCWWVQSGRPWESLSSAVYGGGRRSGIHAAANVTVEGSYRGADPGADLARRLEKAGVPRLAVGMMTAVNVSRTRWAVDDGPGGRWFAAVTAGTKNALCAGEKPDWLSEGPGTINMIAIYDGELSEEAAVNAVITLTEAKARALRDRGIICAESGLPATGTGTDAVAVLFRKSGRRADYAGPGSSAGFVLARMVHGLLHEILERDEDRNDRPPSLSLVIGGARSGKSEWAETLAARWSRRLGMGVTYVATAREEGMEERIDRHRQRRPEAWATLEAPGETLLSRLRELPETAGVVLIDCLSFWVGEWMARRLAVRTSSCPGEDAPEPEPEWTPEEEKDLLARAADVAEWCRRHPHPVVAVTGEAGLGVAPATAVGCLYRDALGLANQVFARASDQVYGLVAGIPVDVTALSEVTVPGRRGDMGVW